MSVTVEQLRDHAFDEASAADSVITRMWAIDRLFFAAFHATCRALQLRPTDYVDHHAPVGAALEVAGKPQAASDFLRLDQLRGMAMEAAEPQAGPDELREAVRLADRVLAEVGAARPSTLN